MFRYIGNLFIRIWDFFFVGIKEDLCIQPLDKSLLVSDDENDDELEV